MQKVTSGTLANATTKTGIYFLRRCSLPLLACKTSEHCEIHLRHLKEIRVFHFKLVDEFSEFLFDIQRAIAMFGPWELTTSGTLLSTLLVKSHNFRHRVIVTRVTFFFTCAVNTIL